MSQQWTTEETDFLKENYDKLTSKELAKHLGRDSGGVRAKALKLGLKKGPNKKNWSEEEKQQLKKLCEKGYSIQEIADKLNRPYNAVQLTISRNGWGKNNQPLKVGQQFDQLEVTNYVSKDEVHCKCRCCRKIVSKRKYLLGNNRRSCGCLKSINRKGKGLDVDKKRQLSIKESFFQESHNTYYILGVFYLAGYVKGETVAIKRQPTRKQLLEFIKSQWSEKVNIRFEPNSNRYVLRVKSAKLAEFIATKHSDTIPPYWYPDFLRGIIDAQSILYKNPPVHQRFVDIKSKFKNRLQLVQNKINDTLNINCDWTSHNKIRISSHEDIQKLSNFIYNSAGFYLTTTHTKINEILDSFIDTSFSIDEDTKIVHSGCEVSKEEQLVREWLNSFNFNFQKDRSVLFGLELDMYDKSQQLAIEYCGLRWHIDGPPTYRDRNYHLGKLKKCNNQNIRLITMFSDEWQHKQPQVKNFLKSVLGISNRKIAARKTDVISLDNRMAQKFVNNNHIQGLRRTPIKSLGLVYKNELVAVMTFNHHHRKNKGGQLILERLCFADDTTVQGGASKLFKHGREWAKDADYREIITWADRRWSEGNVYYKLGFQLDNTLPPNYSYVDIKEATHRINKQRMTKEKLHCNQAQTELEKAHELGYYRIWDCGKKRFKYIL